MIEKITSLQNSKVKNIVKLQQKSSERQKQDLIAIEGAREIGLALNAGFELESIYVCSDILGKDSVTTNFKASNYYEISIDVYNKLAYRGSTEGIIALAKPKLFSLEKLKLRKNPLIIVLEAVEKPGNLGAILRTADAANVDAVIICDPLTDFYNPNVIRSSVGCVFTNKVISTTSEKAIAWFKKNGIKTYATALTANKLYHETDLMGPTAIIMGTEADGLTEKWLSQSDEQLIIPMGGEIDSLNVSNATAILVFEAMRQRNFYK